MVEFLLGAIAGAVLFKVFHRCKAKERIVEKFVITQNPGG